MAPGGVTGVIMALVFVVATVAFLMLMRRVEELPPVSLTFLIPVVVAAIRWGTLSAAVTAIGGGTTFTLFFYSPFNVIEPGSRSGVFGVTVFLIVSLVLAYLASRTRRDAARALKRENEIRDLYTFSQRLSAANSPAGIFEAMQQHLETLVGRKVLLFDSLGTLEAKSERLGDVEIPEAVTEAVSKMPARNSTV
jgi:two-component system sensor histidine kinase KdpD